MKTPPASPCSVRAYGLRVLSELPLPGLPVDDGPADVRVELAALDLERPPGVESESWFSATHDEARFLWPDFAAVRVTGGSRIEIDPAPGVDPGQLQAGLLGPVFSVLLLMRGFLPLHASALVLHGRAAAFAAGSGGGKSTLAAALRSRGHVFLSDDVTALRFEDGRARMVASYPQQKLTPLSVQRLGGRHVGEGDAPLVNPEENKRLFSLPGKLPDDRFELAHLYVIEDADDILIEPVRDSEALFLLLRHCHRSPLLHRVVGSEEMMRRCALLTERVQTFRLHRPFDLDRLDELLLAVEHHMPEERVA